MTYIGECFLLIMIMGVWQQIGIHPEEVIVYTVHLWAESHPNCGLSDVVSAVKKVGMTLYNDCMW